MRWRPCRHRSVGLAGQGKEPPSKPPLPDNPYRRFYTRTPTFEELVRRQVQKKQDNR